MILQTPIGKLGYSYSGFYIARQLAKLTNDSITIFPIGNPDPELYGELQHLDWRNRNSVGIHDTSVRIWHQHDLHDRPTRGRHVGFPVFELDRFTTQEQSSMKLCDSLLVCSKWAAEIVHNSLGSSYPVRVAPLGVDRNIFNENNNTSRPQTIFFNCGKWEIRKGHDFLLEAFNLAFERSDNVELWMMNHNPFIGEGNNDWINRYKRSKLGDKIRFIPYQKTHRDVYNIMRQVDCGVFPARSEGWNLELLEILSVGKHAIATDYAGHSEFIDDANCCTIPIESTEPAHDGIWFFGQGEWANLGHLQQYSLIKSMRKIHTLKQEGSLGLNIEGINTAKQFSWENTARAILDEYKLE
jgi:glycosyltransferase involved in cell wall biosynthesis